MTSFKVIMLLLSCTIMTSPIFAASAVGAIRVMTFPQPGRSVALTITGAAAKMLFDTLMNGANMEITEHGACNVSYVEGQGVRCFLEHSTDRYQCGISIATDGGAAVATGGISCIE